MSSAGFHDQLDTVEITFEAGVKFAALDLDTFTQEELLQLADLSTGLDYPRTRELVNPRLDKKTGFNESVASRKQTYRENHGGKSQRRRRNAEAEDEEADAPRSPQGRYRHNALESKLVSAFEASRSPDSSPPRRRGRPRRPASLNQKPPRPPPQRDAVEVARSISRVRNGRDQQLEQVEDGEQSAADASSDAELSGSSAGAHAETRPARKRMSLSNTSGEGGSEDDEMQPKRIKFTDDQGETRRCQHRKDDAGGGDAETEHSNGTRKGKATETSEADLFEFLKNMVGRWTSKHRRRKIVPANGFPSGWTVCVGLRQKQGRYYFEYRDYTDPQGKTWSSFKEAAAHLVAAAKQSLHHKEMRTGLPLMLTSEVTKTSGRSTQLLSPSMSKASEKNVSPPKILGKENLLHSMTFEELIDYNARRKIGAACPSSSKGCDEAGCDRSNAPAGSIIQQHPLENLIHLETHTEKSHDFCKEGFTDKQLGCHQADSDLKDGSTGPKLETEGQGTHKLTPSSAPSAGKAESCSCGDIEDQRHVVSQDRGSSLVLYGAQLNDPGSSEDAGVKGKKLTCPVCGVRCRPEQKLRSHLIRFNHMQDFACDICGQIFTSKSLLFSHRYRWNHCRPVKRDRVVEGETGQGEEALVGIENVPSILGGRESGRARSESRMDLGESECQTAGMATRVSEKQCNIEFCEDAPNIDHQVQGEDLSCPSWPCAKSTPSRGVCGADVSDTDHMACGEVGEVGTAQGLEKDSDFKAEIGCANGNKSEMSQEDGRRAAEEVIADVIAAEMVMGSATSLSAMSPSRNFRKQPQAPAHRGHFLGAPSMKMIFWSFLEDSKSHRPEDCDTSRCTSDPLDTHKLKAVTKDQRQKCLTRILKPQSNSEPITSILSLMFSDAIAPENRSNPSGFQIRECHGQQSTPGHEKAPSDTS